MISFSSMVDEYAAILGIDKEAMLRRGGSDGKMPKQHDGSVLSQVGGDGSTPSKGNGATLKRKGSDGAEPTEHGTLRLKFMGYDGTKPTEQPTLKLRQRDTAGKLPRKHAPDDTLTSWSSAEKAKAASALVEVLDEAGIDKAAFLGSIARGLGKAVGRAKGTLPAAAKKPGLVSRLRGDFAAGMAGKGSRRAAAADRAKRVAKLKAAPPKPTTPAPAPADTSTGSKLKGWWNARSKNQQLGMAAGAGAAGMYALKPGGGGQ